MTSKAFRICCALILVTVTPASSFAWGFAGHRLIMRRAIDLLPPELKPFFDRYRDEVVMRVVDPDLWRNVGFEDNPHHFIDFGVPEYGAYPFTALPREYGAAVEKFGMPLLRSYGLLPWRQAEEFGQLRREFGELRRSAPYTVSNIVLYSAVAAHYVQDGYQPFHATDNFDGQKTGSQGIHSRFERDLIERFEARLHLAPEPATPMTNARDAAFESVLAGYQLVDPILKADRDAVAGRDTYDDVYFEKFFTAVQPVLERRLSGAITATASMIVGAWDQAGRPPMRLSDVRPAERVRKPQ
jgi:hypothetical protein